MLKVKITNPRKSMKRKVNYLTQCQEATPPNNTEKQKDKRSSSKKQKNTESGNQSIVCKNSGKYNKQKMLATERQRRRQTRMTAEERDIKRQKDRERYYKKKEEKMILQISQRSKRDQTLQRKKWRENSQNYRARKSFAKNLTPQESDNEDDTQSYASSEGLYQTPQSSCISTFGGVQEPKQKKNAKKQGDKKMANAYDIIKKQNNTIKQLRRQLEMYKKRYYQQKNQLSTLSPSPRKQLSKRSDSVKIEIENS